MSETPGPEEPWTIVASEVTAVLRAVSSPDARRLLARLEAASGRCFFTGQGRSGFVAQMAAMRLMQLGMPAHVVGEATAPAFSSGDVLVVVSGSGSTPASLLFAREARALGGSVCCLTACPDGPIARLSDPCVVLPAGDSVQFRTVLFTQAALLLVDGLCLLLSDGDTLGMTRRHANLQ